MRSPALCLGHYIGEFTTPGIGYMLAEAGCEYAFLDMEHSAMSFDRLGSLLRFMEAADLPAMVRVPSHSYDHIARALDLGAEGIVIPMLGTAAEAEAVIQAMKYTPMGKRGVAPGLGNDLYKMRPVTDMLAASNERTALIGLIETVEGIENVDAIAALPEVDCLWVGHFDLSCSLGIPGEFDHPRFASATAKVHAAGKKHGKALGRLVGTVEEGVAVATEGWNLVCYGGDVWIYQAALHQGLDGIRSRVEAAPAAGRQKRKNKKATKKKGDRA